MKATKNKATKMFIKLRNRFIAGIAVIFPVAVTIVIIRFLVIKINSWILEPMTRMLDPFLTGHFKVYAAKTGIFILVFLCISLVGWAADIIVIRKFFSIWEKILIKVPMFGRIYQAIKQISTAFLGQGKTIFKKVVLVEYPRKGVFSIGFVTGPGKGEIQSVSRADVISVFIPTTPNPTSGIFLLVPKNDLKYLGMNVEEGMKLVISGGAVVPPFESIQSKEDHG